MILSRSANFFPTLPEMQYRYSLPVKKEALRYLDALVRLVVFCAVLIYLYHHLQDQDLTLSSMVEMVYPGTVVTWLAVLLVPFNLGLEAWRWQYILSLKSPVRFSRAAEGVLAGMAFALVTPHAVGDYLGRLMATPVPDKQRYVGSIMISRVALLMWTMLFGAIGVYYLYGVLPAIACAASGPLSLVLIYFVFRNWNFPGRRFVASFLEGLQELKGRQLVAVCFLGLLRYLVFTFQFFLLLQGITPLDPFLILAGVTWIFLAKSVIPSVNFLGDLGVREFSAVLFFAVFTRDTWAVVAASLLLWCINIALPALAGSVILLKERLK